VELTFYTDYSLRVLMYLGLKSGRLCSVAEVAGHYHVSRNHLVKVVHGLARGGFVRTYRGKGGGVTLGAEPEQINIGAVVRYTEGPLRPVECFRGADLCVISDACRLAGIVLEACEGFLAVLDRYTLADLLVQGPQLRRLLSIAPQPERRT
jgi:Rrf2 family transcriptional regulator, nitric oxide-sensitive transcriptional repressor